MDFITKPISKLIHGGDIYTVRERLAKQWGNSADNGRTQVENSADIPALIDFSANINPLGLPTGVKEALIREVENFDIYPDPLCRSLISALSEHERVPAEWLLCGNGAADLIFRIVYAVRPKKAMVLAPTFAEYEEALKAVSCEVIHYALSADNSFQADEGLLEVLDDDLDILFLCNPNNPTGQLMSKELLTLILERCRKLGILLIVDECFNDFLDEPERYSIKDRIKDYKNLLILKAFTKIYAMAGLRLGYCLTLNNELLEVLRQAGQPWSVSTPAQIAGIQAMKEIEYIKETKKLLNKEREYLLSALEGTGITTISSGANYIFFRDEILRERPLHEQLLDQGILIRDCSNYHGLSHGYYRICIRSHQDNQSLVEALGMLR